MTSAFAMWIEDAAATSLREPQILLSGAPLGRAPEIRDALRIFTPFSRPLRVHCRSVLSHPRGAHDMRFTFGIERARGLAPSACVGAVVVEEGTAVRAFSARLRTRAPTPFHAAARFLLQGDRAWGLVAARGHVLNIVVVGGGLADDRMFWELLERIEPNGHGSLGLSDLELVSVPFAIDSGFWQLSTLRSYIRGAEDSALVLRSAGPVTMQTVPVYVDGEWRECDVLQQSQGLTQIRVRGVLINDPQTVLVPLPVAA